MRLLIFSHPAVVTTNQQLFAAVRRSSGMAITLVVPRMWRSAYGPVAGGDRWPGFDGDIRPMGVLMSGNVPLHLYRGNIAALIAASRPDVIYVHHEPYGLATAQILWANQRVAGVPFGFYAAQNVVKHYAWPVSSLERWVLSRSAFAFPITDAAAQVLATKGFRGEISVLPLGIDPDAFRRQEPLAELAALRSRGPVIGFVGRLAHDKGIDTLLKAVAALGEPSTQVALAGDGPLAQTIDRWATELGLAGRVHRLGYVPHDKMAACYSGLDVLVLPSRTRPNAAEQFGRVIVEALATGVPVIGSTCGEIPLLMAELQGGTTFPEDDPAALTDRLRALLSDPVERQRLARRGQGNVLARYSHAAQADRFVATIMRSLQPSV